MTSKRSIRKSSLYSRCILVLLVPFSSLFQSTILIVESKQMPSLVKRSKWLQRRRHSQGARDNDFGSTTICDTTAENQALFANHKMTADLTGTIPHAGAKDLAKKQAKTSAASPWVEGLKNSMASALAAGCSKTLLAPFDTIKTLQQHYRATSDASLSLMQAARMIMERPGGFWELYAGLGVAVVGSMPSVGLYFGVYSYCKRRFLEETPLPPTVGIAASAAIGNTVASFSRVPYEVLKQKLQTGAYQSTWEALVDLKNNNWGTLFPTGGIAIQMLRDIPYAMVTLLCYEYLKSQMMAKQQQQQPNVKTAKSGKTFNYWDMLTGGVAGGVGSLVTNPFDVLKTRLQIASSDFGGSVLQCAKDTWEEGGPSAFMRGSVPRLLHKVPANAFFFLFYEFFQRLLSFGARDTATNSEEI